MLFTVLILFTESWFLQAHILTRLVSTIEKEEPLIILTSYCRFVFIDRDAHNNFRCDESLKCYQHSIKEFYIWVRKWILWKRRRIVSLLGFNFLLTFFPKDFLGLSNLKPQQRFASVSSTRTQADFVHLLENMKFQLENNAYMKIFGVRWRK